MITIALVAILISLFAFLLNKAIKANQYWEKKGIKYLKPVPFFGNSLQLVLGRKSPQDIIQDLYDEYPKEEVLGYYEFMNPRLYIRDVDLIQKILIKDFAHFTDHGLITPNKKFPREEQLFMMTGSRWRTVRVKISPIFTSGKLKEMYTTMASIGTNLLGYLKERETKEVDAGELMGLFSMDVISSAVFGMDPATLKNPDCEFRKLGRQFNAPSMKNKIRMSTMLAFPKLMKIFGIPMQELKLTNYFCDIIQNAFDYRKEKGLHRNDFIQMMMQLKEKGQIEVHNWDTSDDFLKSEESEHTLEKVEITDDLLMAQALTFMVAGFDATAFLMSYTIYEFTQHQDIQDKVRAEVTEQVKLHGGLTYDALKNMKLLECCIKETQRYYPLVPALFRVCTKEYVLPNGYVIEKGDQVAIPVTAVHMDPKNYPDPKVYNPERFLDPIKPGTYLPFGEGPRICIAMRYAMLVMKYGLALFFLNYRVKLSPKVSVPLKFNKTVFLSLPKEKILLSLEKTSS